MQRKSTDLAAMPLHHYAETWLRSMQGEVKERTLTHYEQALRTHVLPALGDRPVGSIAVSDVRDFKEYLLRRGLSASSVKGTFAPLRRHAVTPSLPPSARTNPAERCGLGSCAAGGVPTHRSCL